MGFPLGLGVDVLNILSYAHSSSILDGDAWSEFVFEIHWNLRLK